MKGVIVSGDPEWMDAPDVSSVPDEHVDFWLSYSLHSFKPFIEIRHNAREILVNLRILKDRKVWEKGLIEECYSWEDLLLKSFRITPEQFAWLEAGEPFINDTDTLEVGIAKGKSASEQAAQMVISGEAKTQTEAAELFDISQQAVSKAMRNTTESCDSQKEVVIPDHLHGDHEKADFRKLSPEGQERVRQKEPLNRVAIAEGVRIKLSPLERIQAAFTKLSREDREAFTKWFSDQAH